MTLLTLLQKRILLQNNTRELTNSGLHSLNTRREIHSEKSFLNILHLERKRSERSGRSFMLVVIGLKDLREKAERRETIRDIALILNSTIRETDAKGWYRHGESIGVIFNEISGCHAKHFETEQQHTLNKVREQLDRHLGSIRFQKLEISYQVFPGDFIMVSNSWSDNSGQYANVGPARTRRVSFITKRIIDISGSLFAIILFSPVFLAVAVLIKANSQGAVFFKQERVGLYGRKFMFLKFRSMYENNDPSIHKEFVRNLIVGNNDRHEQTLGAQHVSDYKIKNDPRVTSIGRFLRKTSIDELPQFFNVLKGDMSLVGPRPPIPYECEEYDIWHRSRVLDMKPGITGLWQVTGRSTTSFDDMARMDIRYVREWSLWMDLKILLKTPLAVLTCRGAY